MRAAPWVNDRSDHFLRRLANFHHQGADPSVVLLATPRSGSTWLMEMIRTQPGFKSVEEPLNLRNPDVRRYLGFTAWGELHEPSASAALEAYFAGFLDGRLRFMDHRPFRRHHRWLTNRIVFKVLHGAEDQAPMFRDLGLRIVHLVRHPLAVARSRRSLPRLDALVDGDYLRRFPRELATFATRTAADGSPLERAVLSWCLQNRPLLGSPHVLVAYEQLVTETAVVVAHLADRLGLPKPNRMLARRRQPSGSSDQSDERRRELLATKTSAADAALVDSWTAEISPTEARRAMDIVEQFGIQVYSAESPFPAERYLVSAAGRPEVRSA